MKEMSLEWNEGNNGMGKNGIEKKLFHYCVHLTYFLEGNEIKNEKKFSIFFFKKNNT